MRKDISKLLQIRYKKKPGSDISITGRAWIEINMANLNHNVRALQEVLTDGCEIMAVVKANAYGHGDVEIAKYLSRIGIKSFAVATVDEGIHLRKHGVMGNILILGYTSSKRALEMVRYNLIQTVADYDHAKELNAVGKLIQVHIKIDTGMHRLGEDYCDLTYIIKIFQCKNLNIRGIFTHLCISDSFEEKDMDFTKDQIRNFYTVLDKLKLFGYTLPKIHIQSSYGVLNYPGLQCDYARIGIAMYGVLSSIKDKTKLQIKLLPVLSLKSRVALIRTIEEGESVGYGRAFIALRKTRIALLPIGFADGVPRSISCGNGEVLIHGQRAPVIGLICMDQLMIDVTDITCEKNEIAVLIGSDGSEKITAEQMAANADTTTNELLSRLSSRLDRSFVYGEAT